MPQLRRSLPEPQVEQTIYYIAKGTFDMASADLDEALRAIPVDKRFGDPRTEQAYVDSGWYAARDLLTEAENDLVEWGFRMIDLHGDIMGITDPAGLANLRANWRKHAHIRIGLIQACAALRCEPTK